MKIEVLGSGCASCKNLFELTVKAAKNVGIVDEVAYVTDVQKIIDMGMMSSPVLAINGKPILAGYVPNQAKLEELLSEHL